MSDRSLLALAQAAGIATSWTDVFGKSHDVAPPTLQAVLAALGFSTHTEEAIHQGMDRLAHSVDDLPPLITAWRGEPVELPVRPDRYKLTLEDGRNFDGYSENSAGGSRVPAILEPGYHRLEVGKLNTIVAVAPRRCFTVPEATGVSRGWGIAVQLYALRRRGDAGIGDFTALAEFATQAAERGAQAIGISPVHAQFSADPDRFSPYAPSSRTALNILHTAIDVQEPALEALDLVDWPAAARFRLGALRTMFSAAQAEAGRQAQFAAFRNAQGQRLSAHALFEALHGHFFSTDSALWHWRDWPAEFRDPSSKAVAAFAESHADEVTFHAWLQFEADRGLAAAQTACRQAGMGIGLISDLAVGTESGGSQCWSDQQETLLGLSIGAPPDLMQRSGQNWGLTAFSPVGLKQNGFSTYRGMLQTALAHAGGMRIDHAMGLNRLWVIPEGGTGADGAYLGFPEADLIRLIALESHRHSAIVLAEDLGTVPDGFQARLHDAGIDGMRVLWFERDKQDRFTAPSHWDVRASAMTSTHDLPTVAGWWSGRDLDWQEQLGRSANAQTQREHRARDRIALWDAMEASGAAAGEMPTPDEGERLADLACVHVGSSACELVMLPIEDALALVEQPNLPGTIDEHPNWRRRLPAEPFDDAVTHRLRQLAKARRRD